MSLEQMKMEAERNHELEKREYQQYAIRVVLEQMEEAEALAKRMGCSDIDVGAPYREMLGRIRRGEAV